MYKPQDLINNNKSKLLVKTFLLTCILSLECFCFPCKVTILETKVYSDTIHFPYM